MSSPALAGKAGVCSIDVQSVEFNWRRPWERLAQVASYGTGFVIEGHRILTNAHVVQNAIDVRVRLMGDPTKYKATVVVLAPEVDLALLQLADAKEEDKFFYNGKKVDDSIDSTNNNNNSNKRRKGCIALQFAEDLPNLQERVHVAGFPHGGQTICVTEGVVSRIDIRSVSVDPRVYVLCIQIDAAINSGNSGGPVFDKNGRVAGVAFQKQVSKGSDNIGYIIAASTVQAFLSRCHDDGTYTLAASVPYRYRSLFNRSLRAYHNVPEDIHGVLLTSTAGSLQGELKPGDVLTKIDDYQLASDGQVYLRNDELIRHPFVLSGKRFNEPTVFTVYRDGKLVQTKPITLTNIPYLYPQYPTVDHQPDYLFIGPALFIPYSDGLGNVRRGPGNVLRGSIANASTLWPDEWKDGQTQIVLLVKMMAHDESFDITGFTWRQVIAYNGTPVKSLSHMRDMWEATRAKVMEQGDSEAGKEEKHEFAHIECELAPGNDIVFEVKGAMKAEADVMRDHNIPKPSVILPPNPKYRF